MINPPGKIPEAARLMSVSDPRLIPANGLAPLLPVQKLTVADR
ncbi:MAG: hypothetical protein QOJ73_7371 [Streptosporangiaceae bacterium]|nr:hypothetical protein [Streptosporangiaceae bacterium]